MNACRKRYELALGIVLLAVGATVFAGTDASEANDVERVLAQRIRALRKEYKSIEIGELVNRFGYKVVPAAEPYLDDPEIRVRLEVFGLVRAAGLSSNVQAERQDAVQILLGHALKHKEDGGRERLLLFRKADFSDSVRQKLTAQLETSPDYQTILLVGAADVNSTLAKLKRLVDEVNEPLKPFGVGKKESHSLAFAALMARARMGAKEDAQRCIQVVESHKDEAFRVGVLLKTLSYVRQPEVVEYIRTYLFMDKVEPGPQTQLRMTYAQRTMIALSEMLEDFPLREGTKLKFDTPEEATAFVRKWMNEQKQWHIIR